jgi:hypothetical protein
VQTFLPYADFEATARALDDRRLGKQRVEALQILRALTRETYGWKRHPAVLMWAGAESGLVAYGLEICAEWVRRGRADTCAATIRVDADLAGIDVAATQAEAEAMDALPWWLGDERLHASHRAALVRKEPAWYGERFPDADPEDAYWWPGSVPPGLSD